MSNQDLYSKKKLLDELKAAGTPVSYRTLIKYENHGIISRPKRTVEYSDRSWRMYSKEEIEAIKQQVKDYRDKGLVATGQAPKPDYDKSAQAT